MIDVVPTARSMLNRHDPRILNNPYAHLASRMVLAVSGGVVTAPALFKVASSLYLVFKTWVFSERVIETAIEEVCMFVRLPNQYITRTLNSLSADFIMLEEGVARGVLQSIMAALAVSTAGGLYLLWRSRDRVGRVLSGMFRLPLPARRVPTARSMLNNTDPRILNNPFAQALAEAAAARSGSNIGDDEETLKLVEAVQKGVAAYSLLTKKKQDESKARAKSSSSCAASSAETAPNWRIFLSDVLVHAVQYDTTFEALKRLALESPVAELEMITTSPLEPESALNKILSLLASAAHTVDIAGYVFSSKSIANCLAGLVSQKQVRVRVIVDYEQLFGDEPSSRAMSDAVFSLLEWNIEVYAYRVPNPGGAYHCKTITVDDFATAFGSFNWSESSLDRSRNVEIGIITRIAAPVKQIQAFF